MSLATRIAGLSVVTVPVVGLSNLHWVVSHFSTIATGAAAITVGAGVWGGHALIGKVKLGSAERKAAKAGAVESAQTQSQPQALTQGQPTAAEAQAYLQGIREALLTKQAEPSTSQRKVIDLGHV